MRDHLGTGKVEFPQMLTLVLVVVQLLLSLQSVATTAFLPQQQPRAARSSSLCILDAEIKKKSVVPTRSKLTPAQRLLQKNAEAKGAQTTDGGDGTTNDTFDSVKEAFYFVGDNLGKISQPKKKEESKVYDGYKGAVKGQTPVQQILSNPLIMNKPDESDPSRASSSAPKAKESTPKSSVFDSLKETIYGTADLVKNQPKKSATSTETTKGKPLPPIQRIASANAPTDKFKPAVAKPPDRILDDAGVTLQDLQSTNPLIRTAAEWKLRNAQFQQNAQQTRQKMENTVEVVKESLYKAGEVVQKTATEVERLPDRSRKMANDVRSFFQAIPGVVEDTVDTIAAIPKEVEQKVSKTVETTVRVVDEVKAIPTKVQKTAAETVETTVRAVDEVKAIPAKVKKTAESTVDTAVKVVNNVKAFPSKVQETIDEVSYNTKVLLGQEKPKLKPKPPASPPKDGGDVAWRVAGTVAKGVGEAAWFVTKGAAQLGWKGVKAGLDMAQEQLAQQQQKSKQSPGGSSSTMSAPPRAGKPPPPKRESPAKPIAQMPPPSPKIEPPKAKMTAPTKPLAPPKKEMENKPDAVAGSFVEKNLNTAELDAEIAEALQAAKSALTKPSKSEDDNESSGNNKEVA